MRSSASRPYHIAIAPSGFKECLSAQRVAEAIAEGLLRADPTARLDLIPLVDGGEGTAKALAAATGGELVRRRATGPVGEAVSTHFALLGRTVDTEVPTAVVEMAAVAGLSLVPTDRRDPGRTTTHGVGELVRAALDHGARRILIGCGDSGTSDGGAGTLRALGARLLDADGEELPPGGRALPLLDRVDPSGLDPRLRETELLVACNPFNVLCGPRGVARVFGPQKGASPAQVELLAHGLERWAEVLTRDVLPHFHSTFPPACDDRTAHVANAGAEAPTDPPSHTDDLAHAPGTGASGGLGAGLAALGARLLPRFEALFDGLDGLRLDARLARADLVVTAEGALDAQTVRGKIPAEVARRAALFDKPVLALAGTLGEGADEVRASGIDAYHSIVPAPMPLDQALADGHAHLATAAEHALRTVLVGTRLARETGRDRPHRQPQESADTPRQPSLRP